MKYLLILCLLSGGLLCLLMGGCGYNNQEIEIFEKVVHNLEENCRKVGYLSGYIDAKEGRPFKYNIKNIINETVELETQAREML